MRRNRPVPASEQTSGSKAGSHATKYFGDDARYAGVNVNAAAVKNAVMGTHFVGNGTIGSVYETSGSDYNIYSLLDYNGDEALHSVGPNNVVANNRN